MKVLAGLEPERVFYYFERICSIPHGSGNTNGISGYLADFAAEHGLPVIRDALGNVIISKQGTPGKEDHPPVMLQGHMDMVCQKTPDSDTDFQNDGLKLQLKDGIVTAEGTTLGGDDGIALAYALAVLEAADIPHPPIEAVFTVDEEIGMIGAEALDASLLHSKTMLNMDAEDEGILVAGCAGGMRAALHLPVRRDSVRIPACGSEHIPGVYRIRVTGLIGGHSGMEIDKGRGNAVMILGRVLQTIRKEYPFRLISFSGGGKDNAIPPEAEALIFCEESQTAADPDRLEAALLRCQTILAKEYMLTDPGIRLLLSRAEAAEKCSEMNVYKTDEPDEGSGIFLKRTDEEYIIAPICHDDTGIAVLLLRNLPDGIQKMSFDIEGLVQTSLNAGIAGTSRDGIDITFSLRSSVDSEKEELAARLEALAELAGCEFATSYDYPAWEYRKDSPLRDIMVRVFEEQYGRKPEVQVVHAGVECGIFTSKISGLDCISIGPDIKDIHTVQEAMDVGSVKRTWDYLLGILERL